MKHLYLLILFLFLGISFNACDKDDDNDVCAIVGSWALSHINYNGNCWTYCNPNGCTDPNAYNYDMCWTYHFEENGVFHMDISYYGEYYPGDYDGDWSISFCNDG